MKWVPCHHNMTHGGDGPDKEGSSEYIEEAVVDSM